MVYKTKEQKKTFYGSGDWISLRLEALERDNYECQECKRQGLVTIDSTKTPGEKKQIVLNVHHIKGIEDHPEFALELDNLETLCVYHHNEVHGKGFKAQEPKWDDEKW
ncbi:HNH endonuclease [Lederbergia lenta]|uniref:HNH endonuclease n=1 Tax=Lederbergia lenta TaxID=1467 RepID=UPI002041E30D|nr:HNH endonuclease signature motif containing protein [Lederbergia lenta]MCM3111670.1 HNH endonuclease [Lederbergia lenta]